MLKKNHWAIPGFTCIAMLSLSACGGGSGGNLGTPGDGVGGGAGGGTPVVDFTVPNAYAVYGESNATEIGKLNVFGDSYSAENAKNNAKFDTWAERMVARTDGGSLNSFAKGEASANSTNVYYNPDPVTGIDPEGDDPNNTLKNQVDRFEAAGGGFAANDLTVVYMGYNDVNMLWDDPSKGISKLTSALNDYETELDRLIAGGATVGDRKVFLTLIHDWNATPKKSPASTTRWLRAVSAATGPHRRGMLVQASAHHRAERSHHRDGQCQRERSPSTSSPSWSAWSPIRRSSASSTSPAPVATMPSPMTPRTSTSTRSISADTVRRSWRRS
ncbi:MAG: hypothetical protein R3C97_03405 [Geminicoccaceae bacterium]